MLALGMPASRCSNNFFFNQAAPLCFDLPSLCCLLSRAPQHSSKNSPSEAPGCLLSPPNTLYRKIFFSSAVLENWVFLILTEPTPESTTSIGEWFLGCLYFSLFCCCGKTPGPRQLVAGRVCFVLESWRSRGRDNIAACHRHGGRIRKQEAHTVDCKHRANLKWWEGFSSKALQLGSSVQIWESMRDILVQTMMVPNLGAWKSQSPKLLGLTVEEGPFPMMIQGR